MICTLRALLSMRIPNRVVSPLTVSTTQIVRRAVASELMSAVSTVADGLGLSGTNILAVDSKIDNGDDCFAITTPSRNITMRKATCGGPGTHGLSIGSLGKNQAQVNTVRDITFGELTEMFLGATKRDPSI